MPIGRVEVDNKQQTFIFPHIVNLHINQKKADDQLLRFLFSPVLNWCCSMVQRQHRFYSGLTTVLLAFIHGKRRSIDRVVK